jgi:membrane-bound acyltransferase YfiQ involved in biofilm formation
MAELLQEVRVAQTGTQILFAFLLGVPFTQRFSQVTDFQETVYFCTLLAAAIASAFLIAPSAYHRILFRQREKPYVIRASNRLIIVGLSFVAVAMTGVILLISDLLYKETTTAIATAAIGALFVILWYVVPIARRIRD